jgi:hypothetical protein
MSDTGTPPRIPRTTWEYCLSAADELVLWHLNETGGTAAVRALQPEVVVLLAAAAHSAAETAALSGPQIAQVQLTAPDGQASMLATVHWHALSVLQACPATDRLGERQRTQLIDAYGTAAFTAVQDAAEEVLQRGVADEEPMHPTVADRAAVVAKARLRRTEDDARAGRERMLQAGAELFGTED